jgi:hypothetical protein
VNRVVLTALGALLLAAGVLVLLLGLGALGAGRADDAVLPAGGFAGWVAPVVGAGGLLVAGLSAWWLVLQARTDRLAHIRLEDADGGRTVLDGAALTRVVEEEVEALPGVARASAHLSGTSGAPRLHLRVRLAGRADPGEVHRAVTGEVLPRAREALELDRLPARVELDLPRSTGRALS